MASSNKLHPPTMNQFVKISWGYEKRGHIVIHWSQKGQTPRFMAIPIREIKNRGGGEYKVAVDSRFQLSFHRYWWKLWLKSSTSFYIPRQSVGCTYTHTISLSPSLPLFEGFLVYACFNSIPWEDSRNIRATFKKSDERIRTAGGTKLRVETKGKLMKSHVLRFPFEENKSISSIFISLIIIRWINVFARYSVSECPLWNILRR